MKVIIKVSGVGDIPNSYLNPLKMVRLIFIISYLSLCAFPANSQKKGLHIFQPLGRNTGASCIIDSTNLQIYYAFCASDILNEDTYRDLFCLEIGEKHLKFYSQYLADAEENANKWSKAHPKANSAPRVSPEGRYHNGWSEYQYSQWFISNDTLTEYSCFPLWLGKYNCYHKERYPEQIWEIVSDTMTVCGQLCQKAVCRFRGRDYTAWFTPNIPLAYGPWKFGGLPGIILKVTDKDNLYAFECVRISTHKKPLLKDEYSRYNEMERRKLLKLQRGINEDYGNYIKLTNTKTGEPVRIFSEYEPIELE